MGTPTIPLCSRQPLSESNHLVHPKIMPEVSVVEGENATALLSSRVTAGTSPFNGSSRSTTPLGSTTVRTTTMSDDSSSNPPPNDPIGHLAVSQQQDDDHDEVWREERSCCFPLDLDLVQQLGTKFATTTSDTLEGEDVSVQALQSLSRDLRVHLMDLTVSRAGRELQRYGIAENSNSNRNGEADVNYSAVAATTTRKNCRLTTGCIPILPGGRILLISSTKSKKVFVLPKGGWEQDESLPVAALRETLEEAGVTGILGPPLTPLTYETKKYVRRQLTRKSETSSSLEMNDMEVKDVAVAVDVTDADAPVDIYSQRITPIPFVEVATVTSVPSPDDLHSHNRLILFPLYVQCIYEHWPEQTRVRRVVTVEEAAVLLHHRPEFSCMLKELRERFLHELQ